MDDRYCPEAVPEIFPGQGIRARVNAENADVKLYAVDLLSGNRIEGDTVHVESTAELSLDIPAMDSACIERVGIVCSGNIAIEEFEILGKPEYTVDCAKLPVEKHHSAYRSVNQFSHFKGVFDSGKNGLALSCADRGAVFTGDIAWQDYEFNAAFTPVTGGACEILVRAQGALRSIAVRLSEMGLSIVRTDVEDIVLDRCEREYVCGREYDITVRCAGDKITVIENGQEVISAGCDLPRGAVGFGVRNGARMTVRKYGVHSL